jgi:hypothetical protein
MDCLSSIVGTESREGKTSLCPVATLPKGGDFSDKSAAL